MIKIKLIQFILKPGLVLSSISALILFLGACSKESNDADDTSFKPYLQSNIEYAVNVDTSGIMQQLHLDLYIPAKSDTNDIFPLVVLIHGGSYLIGEKEGVKNSCEVLQNSGFIVSSINYRLGWRINEDCNGENNNLKEASYRAIQDANAALRFLVTNATKYGIDTNWIFVAGESAGAVTALNSGFLTGSVQDTFWIGLEKKLGGMHNAGNNFPNNYSIKGICNKWGAIYDSNLIAADNKIPVISFHGTNDEYVPFDIGYFLGCSAIPAFGSFCIFRRLHDAGGIGVLYIKEGGVHQPEEYSPEFTMSRTASFFNEIIQNSATSEVFP